MAIRHCTFTPRTSCSSRSLRPLGFAASLLLLMAAPGCGGGGSDAATAAAQSFSVQSVDVNNGEVGYRLNRPIRVAFSRPVDFSTVTPNTFNIAVSPGQMIEDPNIPGQLLSVGGLPAIGEFVQIDDRTIIFQPACPTLDDLSNSGFLRGVEYTLNIPSQSVNGVSLGAMQGGTGLDESFSVTFETSQSEDLSVLFFDAVVETARTGRAPAGLDCRFGPST